MVVDCHRRTRQVIGQTFTTSHERDNSDGNRLSVKPVNERLIHERLQASYKEREKLGYALFVW